MEKVHERLPQAVPLDTRSASPEARRPRRRERVLIIVQNLPVPLDRRVWMECQALVAAGYGVSVICPKGPGDPSYQELDGVRIRKYRPAPPANGPLGYAFEFLYCWLRTFWLALRTFVRDGFGAIQACNPPDTYFALAAPFMLLGVRFVYDQHDLCPEVYESRFGEGGGVLLAGLRLLERATYGLADHVVSTNDTYKAIALERGGRTPDDVTVVRSGPDARRMRPGPARPELRRGRRHLAVYLGIMGPQDGVDLLLRAIAVFVHERGRHDTHFALLGFGDCLEDLKRLASELDLDDYVEFTGPADPAMIADYLSTADVGLGPDPKSPLNDVSTMNKTLEYMAYALPVVSFDLRETRVSAGDAAVFVESPDVRAFAAAVSDLLDDPERRERLGRRGRARIEEALAWQHQSAAYVGVYERLLAPSQRPLRRLLAAARGLFVRHRPAPVTARGALLAVLAVAAGAVASLLRQPGVPAVDTLWGEDGTIFLQQALSTSPWTALQTVYAGYLHVLPRLLTEAVAVLPLAAAAPALAAGAATLTAGTAVLVERASAAHLPWRPARVVLAAAVVLLPVAQAEVFNAVANLHWPLIFVAFWMLLWPTERRWEVAVAAAVIALAVLSDPLVLLLAPLAVARFASGRGWRVRLVPVVFAVGAVLQTVALVTNPTPREFPLELDLVKVAAWYVWHVVTKAAFGSWLPEAVPLPVAVLLTLIALALAAGVAVVAVRTRRRRPTALVSTAVIASVVLYAAPVVLSGYATPRYSVAPVLLLYTAAAAVFISAAPAP
ncbi:MAG TPA: glycosyltransferase family 4 protein, partial [Egibacteraceae bacterium]